jgi:hypothetical protein
VRQNVPSLDLTVVVLTQRAADEGGMPAFCDEGAVRRLRQVIARLCADAGIRR